MYSVKSILSGIALAATLLAPVAASAAEGFATANVNMRSGPSTRYPAVVIIPVGAPVEIHGCLADANWCDVSFSRGRGWVSGSYVQAEYQRSRVVVAPRYYRPLGIPTVTFELGNYWDRNYRNRDFYRDREYWRGGPARFDRDRPRDRDRFNPDRDRPRFDRDRDRDRNRPDFDGNRPGFDRDDPRFDRDRPPFDRDRDGNRDRPRFDRDRDGNRDGQQFDRDRRDNDRRDEQRDNQRRDNERRDNERRDNDRRDNERRDNERRDMERRDNDRPNAERRDNDVERRMFERRNEIRPRDNDRDPRRACTPGEPGCTL